MAIPIPEDRILDEKFLWKKGDVNFLEEDALSNKEKKQIASILEEEEK